MEQLSGQPFDQFLKERIFDPLGMTDTAFYVPEEKLDRVALIYGEGLSAVDMGETRTTPPADGVGLSGHRHEAAGAVAARS